MYFTLLLTLTAGHILTFKNVLAAKIYYCYFQYCYASIILPSSTQMQLVYWNLNIMN